MSISKFIHAQQMVFAVSVDMDILFLVYVQTVEKHSWCSAFCKFLEQHLKPAPKDPLATILIFELKGNKRLLLALPVEVATTFEVPDGAKKIALSQELQTKIEGLIATSVARQKGLQALAVLTGTALVSGGIGGGIGYTAGRKAKKSKK